MRTGPEYPGLFLVGHLSFIANAVTMRGLKIFPINGLKHFYESLPSVC